MSRPPGRPGPGLAANWRSTYFEKGEEAGQRLPNHDFLLGRLFYRMGAVSAIDKSITNKESPGSIRRCRCWRARCRPPRQRRQARRDVRQHRRFLLADDNRREALRLTTQGVQLMEQAAADGLMAKRHWPFPMATWPACTSRWATRKAPAKYSEMAARHSNQTSRNSPRSWLLTAVPIAGFFRRNSSQIVGSRRRHAHSTVSRPASRLKCRESLAALSETQSMLGRFLLLWTLLPLVEIGAVGLDRHADVAAVRLRGWSSARGIVGHFAGPASWACKPCGGSRPTSTQGACRPIALVDGLLVLVAAVLLIIPGVLTDVVAIGLLFPPTAVAISDSCQTPPRNPRQPAMHFTQFAPTRRDHRRQSARQPAPGPNRLTHVSKPRGRCGQSPAV